MVGNRLLKVSEVAEVLGFKEGTVRWWISTRRLTHVKIGRATRIPQAAVEALISAGLVSARTGELGARRAELSEAERAIDKPFDRSASLRIDQAIVATERRRR